MEKHYYQVYLELWRKNKLFGMVNISHIPYSKFEELFKDQVTREKFLFDDVSGYSIKKKLYKKHKEFFDKEFFVDFDFKLFDYWVGLCGDKIETLKRNHYDELPSYFKSAKK